MLGILVWIKKTFLYLLYLFIASFILLELIFRFLPTSQSLETQSVNESSPYIHFAQNKLFRKQTGSDFSHVMLKRTNNYGYLTDTDFHPNRDESKKRISIIGDSYVQATHVENKKTFHGLLSHFYDGLEFYPIGFSGSPLSQYLAFAKFSEKEFNPDKYIFIIIFNDFDESLLEYKQTPGFHYYDKNMSLILINYEPSTLKKTLRLSAFLRYLYLDLKIHVQLRQILDMGKGNSDIKSTVTINKAKKAISHFLSDLSALVNDKKVLFVLDGDRKKIYSGGDETLPTLVKHSYDHFERTLDAYQNFYSIDLNAIFSEHYENNGQRFEWIYDYHWNELGHLVVFEAIRDSKFVIK